MKKTHAAWLLLCLTSLYGCALTVKPYKEPTSGNVAYLNVIKNNTPVQMAVATYVGAENCSQRRKLLGPRDKSNIKFEIEANKPFSFSMSADFGSIFISGNINGCNLFATFIPLENHEYRASLQTENNNCNIVLEEIKNDKFVDIDFNIRRSKSAFDENSDFCY